MGAVQRQPRPRSQAPAPNGLIAKLMARPQVLLPMVIVAGMLGIAFGVQPGGSGGGTPAKASASEPTAAVSPTATPRTTTPTAIATKSSTGSAAGTSTTTADVAGVRATPAGSPTAAIDLTRETTQCGTLQETPTALSVEQSISGISVRATRAAVYPAEYFKCILMATGGQEANALAASVAKAVRDNGATHAVLIDLWITNAAKDFGQVNLRTASLAAAGAAFSPLATLGGRSEVVVSSGQGRAVTLVITVKNGVGANTGPMTLTLDAPMASGKQVPGKYQLFLPTP